MEALVETTCSVLAEIEIESGTWRTYEGLARLHYRTPNIGPVQQIWAARHRPARGPETVAGVAVVGWPVLHSALRNVATGRRYLGPDQRAAVRLLNAEMRTITRVIVAPPFRGLGLATALVRHALAHATTPSVEALSTMGRFHPFFVRAGMQPWDLPRNDCERRIAAALQAAGLAAVDLCDEAACQATIGGAARDLAAALEAAVGREAAPGGPRLPALLAAARRRVLGRPVYYLWNT